MKAYQISVHESEDPIRPEHDIRPGWILVEEDLCLFELRKPISELRAEGYSDEAILVERQRMCRRI